MTKIRKKIGTIPINDIEQQVQQSTQAAVTQMQQDVSDFIDGETAQYPEIGGAFKFQEYPERRSEITTDAEGKIISYRDNDGVKHEEVGINSAVVKTNSLKLSDEGMNDFQQAIKDAGFQPGGSGDWSDRKNIELPEPKHYALINIAVEALPINDEDVSEGYVEYYDGLGNYFKMSCSLEVQGQSSRIFAATGGKGNYTLDLSKDVKFGSWVPQDSFHLKGCANDATVAILPTAYKLAYILMERLDAKPNRVLKKNSEDTTINHATGDRFTDWPDDARCLPDGFPAEIYINGSYWGLYSLQLKKHRKNYTMDKKDYTSFFLDADGGMPDLFLGNIHWNQFEIKNPKDLICMDGSKYDGDHPKELIDNTSQYYDSSNKAHKGSKQTKDIIKSFSTKYLEVKGYIDNSDLVTAKEKFNEYFDYNACMLVYIYNCTMRNGDSVEKNTLWATWKNGKIAPMLWDLSALYGYRWIGNKVSYAPSASFWTGLYATASWPLGLFWTLYSEEIKATYRTLREENIISIETWLDVVVGHVKRVGTEAYKRDIAKWSEVPNYRENFTNTEYWEEGDFYNNLPYDEWDENHNYSAGDIVKIRAHELSDFYMTYTAKKPSIGVCPVTQFYEGFPVVGGFYDGVYRMQKWLEEQLHLCDVAMGYSE